MFREVGKFKQRLSREEAEQILIEGTSGVLAVAGEDDYPYAVPLSYVYENGKIYFHGAKRGYKMDAIQCNPKVSFCVIGQDKVVPEQYTTFYKSVIVFGRARVIEEEEKIRETIQTLARKYHPSDTEENRKSFIDAEFAALCMVEITIDYMTGKQSIELVN